jgi:transcriptional regulator with XRE-family HTH domain
VDRDTEIEILREALRRRAEETTVRQVAAEVGMSHGGVHNLLSGGVAPYGKTLAKLRAWYVDQQLRGGGELTAMTARYLVDKLLAAVPAPVRAAAQVETLDSLTAVYGRFGVPAPPWIAELRDELGREVESGGAAE